MHFRFFAASFGTWSFNFHIKGLCSSAAHLTEFSNYLLGSERLIDAFLKGANHLCPPLGVQSQTWDLNVVSDSLCQPPFEPISETDIKWLSFKTAFLLAITTAKRVSEGPVCAGVMDAAVSHCGPIQHFYCRD